MVRIRPARPEDAAAVADVHVRSWQVGYRGILPDEYLDGLRAEDRMRHYQFGSTDPGVPWTVVAVEDGAVVGFVTTGPSRHGETEGSGELMALYVDPEAWGRGVGRLLVADARSDLSGRGFADAVLWVLVGNERAERFYMADGWASDGRQRRDVIWDVAVEESRYRRLLP